jgi:hypothetical protein
MQRTMWRSVALLVAPVMLLVLVVSLRVAIGRTTAIEDPVVIDLTIGEGGKSRGYVLDDTGGRPSGQLSVLREPAEDADGTHVGSVLTRCFAWPAGWTCESIAKLKDGPYTDEGTVTFEGIFRGFNGEHQAVTGGTGAYENARGYAELHVVDDEFVRTLHLIP